MVWLVILFPVYCWSLVPVEGILRGTAELSYQQDPLRFIFPVLDKQEGEEARKIKLYHHRYQQGQYLESSCSYYGPINYEDRWKEAQVQRSIASTLQYLALDTTIKAIGAYGRELSIDETSYNMLVDNLVNNYCSKNLTTFSLKTVKTSLKHYYHNPLSDIIPRIENSPYATEYFKNNTSGPQTRSNEFEYAIEIFRDFCSWGGETTDYRMMGPYLANRFIMSFVLENLDSKKQFWNEKLSSVTLVDDRNTLKINCDQLICRKVDDQTFQQKFSLSVGSTGLKSDLEKLYCHHFRYQDFKSDTIDQVKEWIKKQSLEAIIFRQNLLLSFLSGVPDPFFGLRDYKDLPFLAKSSIDERWNNWSKEVLDAFSRDLLFEESMKISVNPKSDYLSLATQGYTLDLMITLGEMDRMLGDMDKLKTKFDIELSRNYILWLRKEWARHLDNVDFVGQRKVLKQLEVTLQNTFKNKESYYLQKIWNDDLFRILATEFLTQVTKAPVSWFEHSYQDKMIKIPVTFHYGIFALGYLNYRDNVATDDGKLEL